MRLIASSLLSPFSFCTRFVLVFVERVRHIKRVYKKEDCLWTYTVIVLDIKLWFVQLCHYFANSNSLYVVVYSYISVRLLCIYCVYPNTVTEIQIS